MDINCKYRYVYYYLEYFALMSLLRLNIFKSLQCVQQADPNDYEVDTRCSQSLAQLTLLSQYVLFLRFPSYLTDRTQCVDLEGTISQEKLVQLGVQQCSILGPILFLIYINDMSSADTANKFIKFADDTTILTDP